MLGGTEQLRNGTSDLLDGVGQLSEGTDALLDGAGQLYEGSQALVDGAGQLDDGTGDLLDGANQLFDGMSELKDGLDEFNDEAIQKLISYLNDDFETMSDRAEAMIDLAKDYTSYSGIADNMTGITQFVIKTDGI